MTFEYLCSIFFSKYRHVFFVIALTILHATRLSAATVEWNTDSNGSWNTASNWTSNPSLPGAGDDVIIDRPSASITVTHSGSSTDVVNSLICNESLVLSGGTISVSNTSQINGSVTLSSGIFNGNGEVQINGSFTFAGGQLSGNGKVLNNNLMNWTGGGTLASSGGVSIISSGRLVVNGTGASKYLATSISNAGTITYSSSSIFYGHGTNSTINNLSSGIFDCQDTATFWNYALYPGLPTFNNAGTFLKSAGTGNCSINWIFNNSGIMDVQMGAISLSGGGTHSGIFSIASESTLGFSSGMNDFLGATFDNSGNVNISGGTCNFSDMTFNNSGTLNFRGGNYFVNSSTVIPGEVIMSAGRFDGTGEIVVNNFSWTGGTIATIGGAKISYGGNLTFSGSNSKTVSGIILTNEGTMTWTGLGYIIGEGTNPTINNLAGSIFDCQNDGYLSKSFGSGHTFNNSGTFRKSAGTSITGVDWTFNNEGNVEVQTGTLVFSDGGDNSGTYSISNNAVLQFNGGSHYFEGSAFTNNGLLRFSAGESNFLNCPELAGQIQIDGGTVNLNTVPMRGNLTMSAGNLTGISKATLASLTWSGGTMSGCGIVEIDGIATIRRANTLEARNFINNGTTNVTGSAIVYGKDAATFTNNSEKLVDVQGDGDFYYWSGQNSVLNNAGTLRKSAGTGVSVIEWVFNNTGKLDVQSGTVELRRGGSSNGEFNIALGASLIFNGSTYTFDGGKIVNDGTLL